MSFTLIGYKYPYYCNIERPRILKQHRTNLDKIENRKINIRLDSAKSSKSNNSNTSEKSFIQIRQSSNSSFSIL